LARLGHFRPQGRAFLRKLLSGCFLLFLPLAALGLVLSAGPVHLFLERRLPPPLLFQFRPQRLDLARGFLMAFGRGLVVVAGLGQILAQAREFTLEALLLLPLGDLVVLLPGAEAVALLGQRLDLPEGAVPLLAQGGGLPPGFVGTLAQAGAGLVEFLLR